MEAIHDTVSTSCVARVTSAAVPSCPNSSKESVLTFLKMSARRSPQKSATTSEEVLVPSRMLPRLTAATASMIRQVRRINGKSPARTPLLRMLDISVGSSRSHSDDTDTISAASASLPR